VSAPAAAIEIVGGTVALQEVVEAVAEAVDGADAGQGEVFLIGAQRSADRTLDCVRPRAGIFDDDVAGVIDEVGVVAETAQQAVRSAASVEQVVAPE
jgi:hypothetical protein